MMNVVKAALWLGNLGFDDRKLPAIIHAPPDGRDAVFETIGGQYAERIAGHGRIHLLWQIDVDTIGQDEAELEGIPKLRLCYGMSHHRGRAIDSVDSPALQMLLDLPRAQASAA